ncbi:MAG: acyl-CoA thioesterase [Kaistella sp.]|nr:acyl-CoA thioesterase [Kaistella sp.]
MITSSKVKIRFIDCDPIGHLNNSKYLDYMLNAREDHVDEHYEINYAELVKESGCTLIAIQNEIAYLKEVKYNEVLTVSSKIIEIQGRTAKIEIIMEDEKKIRAVLWCTVIYFNLKTRASENIPPKYLDIFKRFLIEIPEKDFQSRVLTLRKHNKNA